MYHEGHMLRLVWHNSHAVSSLLSLARLIWMCTDLRDKSVWREPASAFAIAPVFFLHGFTDLLQRDYQHCAFFSFFLSLSLYLPDVWKCPKNPTTLKIRSSVIPLWSWIRTRSDPVTEPMVDLIRSKLEKTNPRVMFCADLNWKCDCVILWLFSVTPDTAKISGAKDVIDGCWSTARTGPECSVQLLKYSVCKKKFSFISLFVNIIICFYSTCKLWRPHSGNLIKITVL